MNTYAESINSGRESVRTFSMDHQTRNYEGQWRQRVSKVKWAFSSWSNFNKSIQVEGNPDSLKNKDLLPTLPERRVWNWVAFFSYWFSESWAIATYSLGSTMIAAGMNIWESVLVVFFSNLILAVVCVINSRAATQYHIGYPVLARVTFGIRAHYFFVVLRAILGVIWGGVQLYYQGQFISIMLRCIFSGWKNLHNTIPASQDTDLQTMLGFFFAFLVTLPVLMVHTYKLRHLFTVKSFALPLAGIGIVAWAASLKGGISSNVLVEDSARASSTTAFAFVVLGQMNAVFGATSALIVTIPDLARYAATPRSQFLAQLLGLPTAQTICATFGILTTAALKDAWGEVYWNPYDMLNAILDHGYTPGARAGVFFAALAFAFATLGTSIACNIIPFAADVTCLLPKYINVVRGQILCLVVAFGIAPWKILSSAQTFLNFLGGYSIFQGSIVGIMAVDYFFVRKGNLDIASMYTFNSDAAYHYWRGINWRAVASFIVGFALPFPGFVATLAEKADNVAPGAVDMYNLGWLLSIATGALSYYLFAWIHPVPQLDKDLPFEEKAKDLDLEIQELDYGNDDDDIMLAAVHSQRDEEKM